MSDLPLVLDLFSGTGSATQLFVECGKHRVVRIDIAGRPDVRADVRNLPINGPVQFAWASPPCTEFSWLTDLSYSRGQRGPRDPEKGMELVRVAFDAVRWADLWCVENVGGSERYIAPEFGKPWLRKDAWRLWSNLPVDLLPESNRWFKGALVRGRFTGGNGGRYDIRRRRSRERAMIPRPLAEAVHRAVCDDATERRRG